MALDQTIALQVKPANLDISKPILAAQQYHQSVAQERNIHAEADRREYDKMAEEFSRAAKSVLMMPEGSPERVNIWNQKIDELHQKGYLNKMEVSHYRDKPSNLILNQAIAMGTHTPTHAQMTGETARLEAVGRGPYEGRAVGPTDIFTYPGQRPGSPFENAPPVGRLQGGMPAIDPQPRQPMVPPAMPGAPRSAVPGVNVAGAQPATPRDTRIEVEGDPIMKEVPQLPAKAPPPRVRGDVVTPATTPTDIHRDTVATEHYTKNVVAPAASAAEQRSGFGTMRSVIQDGVDTDKLGNVKADISAWMYAAGMKPDAIRQWTGIDPSKKEIMEKETVQKSMTFVRETIGAREAFMAIQAVMAAFPNMANTKEANLAFIDIMDAASKWKQEKARYAAAFYDKNEHLSFHDRVNKFENWWAKEYPLARFTSEIVPYQVPMKGDKIDASKMQKNIVYKLKDGTPFRYDPTYNQGQ